MAGKTSSRKKGAMARKKASGQMKKWSGRVTATSNAKNLEKNVFKSASPVKVAKSVKRPAGKSTREGKEHRGNQQCQ